MTGAVLVVAGTDSSGGAGLVADVETLRDFGCSALCAVTAVTAQSNASVGGALILPALLVRRQIEMALQDMRVGAVKIGMLGTGEVVAAVADALTEARIPVILDPVLASSSGTALLDDDGVSLLIARLLPIASLVTPNRPELQQIAVRLGTSGDATVEDQARTLFTAGAEAILVKGGHATDETARDLLFVANGAPIVFETPRHSVSMRGTGCRLASAIAAGLARGETLEAACGKAKAYLAARFADAAISEPKPRLSC